MHLFLSLSSRPVWVGSSNHICRTKTWGLLVSKGLIPSGGRTQIPVESLRKESWMGEQRDGMRWDQELSSGQSTKGLALSIWQIQNPHQCHCSHWPVEPMAFTTEMVCEMVCVGSVVRRAKNPDCGEFYFNEIEAETPNRDFICWCLIHRFLHSPDAIPWLFSVHSME